MSAAPRSGPDPLALPPVPPLAPATHPWRDRTLAALFALAIALPGLALVATWSRTTTRFENRPTAAWPAWSTALTKPREFTATFERAFADRFGGRDALIRLHHGTKAVAFGVSPVPNVMLGREGWLYFLGEDGKSLDRHYRGVEPFTDAEVDALVRELRRRHDFLAAQGIGYVVAVVPDKFTIYPEHLPAGVTRMPATPLDRAAAVLARDPRLHFVDLRAPLAAAKAKERVYFLTDSHWNYSGAVVGYTAIMEAVQRALDAQDRVRLAAVAPAPRPSYVPGQDVYSGDLATMLGLPRRFREPDLAPLGKVLAETATRCAKRVDVPPDPTLYPPAQDPQIYECATPGLPRAVVLRDSMAIPLVPLIAQNFARTVFVSTRQLDPALIARERPDVVIEELVERSLNAPAAFPI
jgi:alginate O-acetyltransferase complex protein AlgJ